MTLVVTKTSGICRDEILWENNLSIILTTPDVLEV